MEDCLSPSGRLEIDGSDFLIHMECTPIAVEQMHEVEIARNNQTEWTEPAPVPGVGELYVAYSRRLYRTILAITKNREDAEDVLQETFLRVHLALHTFEGRSTIYSWLTRIAVNSALMNMRKRRARPEILFDPQPDSYAEALTFEGRDSSPNPEEACDLLQRQARLLEAISALSPGLRRPIQMWMRRETSIKEIGRALNLTVAAVKTRLHRARLRLSDGNLGKRTRSM